MAVDDMHAPCDHCFEQQNGLLTIAQKLKYNTSFPQINCYSFSLMMLIVTELCNGTPYLSSFRLWLFSGHAAHRFRCFYFSLVTRLQLYLQTCSAPKPWLSVFKSCLQSVQASPEIRFPSCWSCFRAITQAEIGSSKVTCIHLLFFVGMDATIYDNIII